MNHSLLRKRIPGFGKAFREASAVCLSLEEVKDGGVNQVVKRARALGFGDEWGQFAWYYNCYSNTLYIYRLDWPMGRRR